MLLQIDQVTKTYHRRGRRGRDVRANDGITVGVEEGEVFGLLGHNGAGKTTLINQVVGLLRPDAGRISIDGVDAISHPGYARQACSLQPQAQLPINGLTPRQAIDLLGRLRGGGKAEVRRRRDQLIDSLDLAPWLDTDGQRLSGGVKRLVSFAMAAVVPGRVVVLDEPTNDVDPVRRRLLWSAVRRLADDGSAVLLVTHNVVEAERAVDRLAVLEAGRVVALGTPAQLKSGLEAELRVELTLEPGTAVPQPPPFVHRYLPNGSRVLAIVDQDRAAEALTWAQALHAAGVVGEFALTPASLEDAYIDLVAAGPNRQAVPSSTSPVSEFSHARAA